MPIMSSESIPKITSLYRVIRKNLYHGGHKVGPEFSEIYLCVLCAFFAPFVVKSLGCCLLRYALRNIWVYLSEGIEL